MLVAESESVASLLDSTKNRSILDSATFTLQPSTPGTGLFRIKSNRYITHGMSVQHSIQTEIDAVNVR
jgi:hypothetical protein